MAYRAVATLMFVVMLGACGPFSGPFIHYRSVWDTPLHQAAQGYPPATVRAKIAEAGNVDVRDKHGRTPLMVAAESGSPINENIRVLLEAGADVNAQDERGLTPLMYSVVSYWRHHHGQMRPPEDTLERIRILIGGDADVNARAVNGQTPLMVAAGAGWHQGLPGGAACTFLVENGAAVEARDEEGLTPLMYAARRGAINVPALLAAHADINATDNQGRTALMIAFADEWRGGEAVEALLKGLPDLELSDQTGWTALAHAAWHGRTHHHVDRILDAGARLEPLGWTSLHAAAIRREPARVRALLESGADPNPCDRWGRTPIMWAARYISDDRQSIPTLVRAGGDVNAMDENGATALHIAAANAWDGELYDLLVNGARIDARDSTGCTPLMRAAASRHHEYQVAYLLKSGASVDAIDNQGRTALIHAVLNADSWGDSVPMLLKANANWRVRDASGRIAYDYAAAGLSGRMPAERNHLLHQLR